MKYVAYKKLVLECVQCKQRFDYQQRHHYNPDSDTWAPEALPGRPLCPDCQLKNQPRPSL